MTLLCWWFEYMMFEYLTFGVPRSVRSHDEVDRLLCSICYLNFCYSASFFYPHLLNSTMMMVHSIYRTIYTVVYCINYTIYTARVASKLLPCEFWSRTIVVCWWIEYHSITQSGVAHDDINLNRLLFFTFCHLKCYSNGIWIVQRPGRSVEYTEYLRILRQSKRRLGLTLAATPMKIEKVFSRKFRQLLHSVDFITHMEKQINLIVAKKVLLAHYEYTHATPLPPPIEHAAAHQWFHCSDYCKMLNCGVLFYPF